MSFWSSLPRPVIALSPMDGVTDASFRAILARYGKPDVTVTEFTHVHDVCRGPEYLLETLIYSDSERPVLAQLYGKDPDLFYLAAHAVCELGFDGVDINMGCPSKNVASSGSGAGLIQTPDLARAIMQATRRGLDDWAAGQTLEQVGFKPARISAFHQLNARRGAVGPTARRRLPLSVKTRVGYETETVESWVEHLLKEQPAVIALHGRTLRQMYRGVADWDAIRRAAALAKGTGTWVLGNGDIQSLDELVGRVLDTGVDGVLVGRGVLGAPWFFQDKERARIIANRAERFSGEWCPSEPGSLDRRFAILLDHARHFQSLTGLRQFHRMRQHLRWYCKGFPHAAALRARMFRVSSVEELESVIDDFQDHALTDVVGTGEVDSMVEGADLASRCS